MYVDINTIQTYNAGDILTAAALQQIRDNGEFFVDPPACSVYNSTTQSVLNATPTPLTADSEFFDNDSMHSTSTSQARITIQTAGRYDFRAYVRFASNPTGHRIVRFNKNGATAYTAAAWDASATINTVIPAVFSLVCSVGDYVYVEVQHSAGAALNVTLDQFSALFLTR